MRTTAMAVPAARVDQLVTTEVDGEVLVYDQEAHHIHHLNATSATVWRLCDGRRTVETIARDGGLTAEVVRIALTKLATANLLEEALAAEVRHAAPSRRAFMKRAAAAAAVPVVVSLTAPHAAAAQSGVCGALQACTKDADCNTAIAGCGQCGCRNGNHAGFCINPGQYC